MSAIDMVIDLCNIIVASNLQVSRIIQEKGLISRFYPNILEILQKNSKI